MRAVVCSDGREFRSMVQAGRATGVPLSSISDAAIGTSAGLFRTAGGLQWAYLEHKLDKWPLPTGHISQFKSRCRVETEDDLPVKRVFTSGEIVQIIGCSRNAVRSAIDSGSLRGFRLFGKHRRVYRSDLICWLRENGLIENKIVLNWVI